MLELSGRRDEALPYFERAYAAMDRAYASESARIRPWQARLGVVIAQRHAEAGNAPEAEHWFRGVLALTPFDPEATRGLAGLLKRSGAVVEAESICRQLEQKSGGAERCEDGDQPGPI